MKSIKKIELLLFFLKQKKLKFNVGSGSFKSADSFNFEGGWFATDIDILNLAVEDEWKKLLYFFRLDNIMAEHVWEHLNDVDTELANKNCFKFLKKGGILRIAVPDGFHPKKEYVEYVKPGGNGAGADDHKILYNYKTMKQRLEAVGFTVQLLEYWDENGNFHFIEWSDANGHIRRSKRYDERNMNGTLTYTSLIVDAIKL